MVAHLPEKQKDFVQLEGAALCFGVVMPALPHYNMDWQCKYCTAKQTVYIGDLDDITRPDVEAVRCYACKRLELTCDESDFRAVHSLYDDETDKPLLITEQLIEEHAYIEDGVPKKD